MPAWLANALLVGIGGAVGAVARYGTSVAFAPLLRGTVVAGYPLATLTVNVAGCFVLGLVAFAPLDALAPRARLALATGFAGALTTFSTIELEAFGLHDERGWGAAALYLALNLVLGAGALAGGRALVT